MSEQKCGDINKYLSKEITYLEQLINKAQIKQKAENSRFQYQCQHCKVIANDLDDQRMVLVKRAINIQDHLGVETGPLNHEEVSLSGNHNDLQDGTFYKQHYQNRQQNF